MNLLISALITLLLIVINGYFAMSEMALVNARRTVLQQEADKGVKKADKAIGLAKDSDRLLATTQVAMTLVGFCAAAVAASSFATPVAAWLASFDVGWLSAIAGALSLIFTTIVVTYVSLVVGELIPRRMALSNAETVAKRVVGPISVFQRLASPVVSFLAVSTNLVSRILRIKDPETRQAVSEEEIKYLVTEQDSLLEEEKRMIHEIFDLGDTVAREVMTPRVDMVAIKSDMTINETIAIMRRTGLSRLPLFQETIDRIVGFVVLKDLLAPLIDDQEEAPVGSWMREVIFVPETKDILPLLKEMQTGHHQIAIVVDEYGGTAGVITVEDIVEEIVGDISDEFDPADKFHIRVSETEWLVDGRLPTEDAIDLGFPVEDAEDYETIAGWLLDTIDTMPSTGDSFEIGDHVFTVESMRHHRVASLRVSRAGETTPTADHG